MEPHNGRRKITRTDVARVAGVSGGTVARVLSGHKEVSAVTREKVLRIIDELGYQPDLVARSLRSGRTKLLGLIVPDEKNPFFQGIISGVGQEASERGYALMLGFSKWGYQKLVEGFLGRKADAVVTCAGNGNADELGPLYKSGIPVCTCSYGLGAASEVPYIVPDYFRGAVEAARHLLRLGHRRIMLVHGGGRDEPSLRMEGWLSALNGAGIAPIAAAQGYWSYEAGDMLARIAVETKTTAALFENDIMAMGFVNSVFSLGLRVPEDISVVGFDDIWMASTFRPPLTTVRMYTEELGRKAAQLALSIASGNEHENIVSPVELVIRDSTKEMTDL